MEHKPDVVRMDDLDGLDLLLQFRRPSPFVARKAELHVLGRKGITIVELDALAQLEIVGQAIGAFVPLGREAGRHVPVRHGFHQRIMQRPQADIRREQRPGLRRIKPRRRQGDVHRPRHLPSRGAFLRQGAVPGGPPVPHRPSGDATEGTLQKTTARRYHRSLETGCHVSSSSECADSCTGTVCLLTRSRIGVRIGWNVTR